MKLLKDVMLPAIQPADVPLVFFQTLEGTDAPLNLLATMLAWVRLDELEPLEVSRLIAAGVNDEDAWYGLARKWMLEARLTLGSAAAQAAALDTVESLLGRMRTGYSELKFYLNTYFKESHVERRPQAACLN